jgi:hypothetical protein
LLFGLVAVGAGASGRYALPFTDSPPALVVAGAALALLGLVQLIRARGK